MELAMSELAQLNIKLSQSKLGTGMMVMGQNPVRDSKLVDLSTGGHMKSSNQGAV